MLVPLMPRYACWTLPLVSSCLISARTVSIGIAKPMPTLPLPPPPVSIWELMPTTLPEASISGPPELPGLIAASVWITLEIEKPLGAWIWRCSAETMPLVTVRSSPNGLPIATTGSPTSSFEESPSEQRVKLVGGGVDLEQGDVGGRVGADHVGAVGGVGGAEFDLDPVGAVNDVVVGEDVPFGVDHEARAGRGAPALGFAEGVERRRRLGGLVGLDEGDALAVAAVDLVDDVGVAFALADRGGGERRGDGRGSSHPERRSSRRRSRPSRRRRQRRRRAAPSRTAC